MTDDATVMMDVCVDVNSCLDEVKSLDWDKMKKLKKKEKEEIVERLSTLSSSISALMRFVADSEFLSNQVVEEEEEDVRIVNGGIVDVSIRETSSRLENIGQRAAKRFKEERGKEEEKKTEETQVRNEAFSKRMAAVFNEDLMELSESSSFTDTDASLLTDLLACGAVSFRDFDSSPIRNNKFV